MLIGILTQPLTNNYGGILQNYALQQVLRKLGHTPITIDRIMPRKKSIVRNFAKACLRLIKSSYEIGLLSNSQRRYLSQEQYRFKKQYINTTNTLHNQQEFDTEINTGKYDAFIVGSDQCWRPRYSPNILNYYLDFCIDSAIKKVAYATSFGVDKWEYSAELSQRVKALSQKFDAISVREKSGVYFCKEQLGVNAEWVLDPTMLLGKDGFQDFVIFSQNTGIVTYLLEESQLAKHLIEQVSKMIGESIVTRNLPPQIIHRFENIKKYKNIPVEEWISNIANSRFVITDSFHGAVFSILFNKPFIVILNGTRGNARLESLLEDFKLSHCIYNGDKTINIRNFDWNAINEHLEERQKESINFLVKSLA